jgi:hypothetical protein
MVPPRLTTLDSPTSEALLLSKLLSLYAEEKRIYQRILQLTRQQGQIVRSGGEIRDVRRILEQKRDCLDSIARLEGAEGSNRRSWEEGRDRWSGSARARLQSAIQEVANLVEAILASEEQNDRLLLAQGRA